MMLGVNEKSVIKMQLDKWINEASWARVGSLGNNYLLDNVSVYLLQLFDLIKH